MARISRRIAYDAILLALALIIFIIEAQIPFIVALPGIKLGLANVVILFAMYKLGPKDTLMITLLRILISSIYIGQVSSFLFSLGGGICCYITMFIFSRLIPDGQAWVTSIFGACAHNLGQIAVAVVIVGSASVLYYLPVLILSAVLCGSITGYIGKTLIIRLRLNINQS